nr:biosynthetic peptidoglycan transglycosylase [Dissulfurirhabdus thermomarina]
MRSYRRSTLLDLLLHPRRTLERVCLWTGAVFWAGLLLLALAAAVFVLTLPEVPGDFGKIRRLGRQRVLQQLEDKGRLYRWVPLRRVNRDLLYAVVLAEDARFFEHHGINYDAVIDALARNLKTGAYAYGASTITQQVARNLFLTRDKTLLRKLREFVLARRLEDRFTKNQILEVYLNIAEFGPDIFGVNAAARLLFGKPPSRIDAAEGAFLALLLPSPRKYHYVLWQNRNWTPEFQAKYRRILRDMRRRDYISAAQERRYLARYLHR